MKTLLTQTIGTDTVELKKGQFNSSTIVFQITFNGHEVKSYPTEYRDMAKDFFRSYVKQLRQEA